jgi:hypothetical protein
LGGIVKTRLGLAAVLVALFLAPASWGMDRAESVTPKCKVASHVRVIVAVPVAPHGPGEQTVIRIAHMACRNDAGYSGWGAVIAPGGNVSNGVHLFPDAISNLVPELRFGAFIALAYHWSVLLQHTDTRVWQTWRELTPAAALTIAQDLSALHA